MQEIRSMASRSVISCKLSEFAQDSGGHDEAKLSKNLYAAYPNLRNTLKGYDKTDGQDIAQFCISLMSKFFNARYPMQESLGWNSRILGLFDKIYFEMRGLLNEEAPVSKIDNALGTAFIDNLYWAGTEALFNDNLAIRARNHKAYNPYSESRKQHVTRYNGKSASDLLENEIQFYPLPPKYKIELPNPCN